MPGRWSDTAGRHARIAVCYVPVEPEPGPSQSGRDAGRGPSVRQRYHFFI